MDTPRAPVRVLAVDMEFDALLPDNWGIESGREERDSASSRIHIVASSCCSFEGTRVSNRVFRSLAPLHLGTDKVEEMARFILQKEREGFVVVTWGGMAADFRVLCSNIGDPNLREQVRELAKRHVDLALCILSSSGMMVGLESCAVACLVDKRGGKNTPSNELCAMWKQGGSQSLGVIRHVQEDALLTGRLYTFILESPALRPEGYTGFRKRVSIRSACLPGGAWVAWETQRSERTMVVPLVLRKGMLLSVRECGQVRGDFPWELKPPFTVESCCAWAL